MLTVEVHSLDQGRYAVEGTLGWDGGRIVCDPPDSELLRKFAALLPEGEDGGQFLRDLHLVYHGTYLWVTPASEKTEGEPSR